MMQSTVLVSESIFVIVIYSIVDFSEQGALTGTVDP